MTGKQIAENLRQNRDRWGRYRYFDSDSESYCVIGLKLSELGVPVETWANQDLGIGTMTDSLCPIELVRLQNANDSSQTVDQLIAQCETPEWAVTNFPLEELAEEFKRRMAQKEDPTTSLGDAIAILKYLSISERSGMTRTIFGGSHET